MISKSEAANYLKYQKELFGNSLYFDKEKLQSLLNALGKESTSPVSNLKAESVKNHGSINSNENLEMQGHDWRESVSQTKTINKPDSNIKKDKDIASSTNRSTQKLKKSVKEGWELSTTLPQLNTAINSCKECPLGLTRDKFVFGIGDPNADLMIIGEAPGADEDAKGEPFVGRAGKLLTKILQAIGFEREDVFIANILKCRPPNNRRPEKSEVDECEPYLKRQIELIKPKFILALGLTSVDTLLKKKHKMKDTRGEILSYHGIKLMVTYHPAALLRNPNWKKDTWEDVQKLRKLYDEARA